VLLVYINLHQNIYFQLFFKFQIYPSKRLILSGREIVCCTRLGVSHTVSFRNSLALRKIFCERELSAKWTLDECLMFYEMMCFTPISEFSVSYLDHAHNILCSYLYPENKAAEVLCKVLVSFFFPLKIKTSVFRKLCEAKIIVAFSFYGIK
jgi:hypothetical protein